MKTIYKYPLELIGQQQILMPKDSRILAVQVQHEQTCLWAEVITENELVAVTINIFGTGHHLPDKPGHYIGTYQHLGGELIFHVYRD